MLALILLASACDLNDPAEPEPLTYSYNFDEGAQGWSGFFTNYSVGQGDGMDLISNYRSEPQPPNVTQGAFLLAATNLSDDVKMLMKRPLDGLAPNTTYQVRYEVAFATNAPSGCAGIGGPPGEAVVILALASQTEPERLVDDAQYYVLNIEQQEAEDDFGGDLAAWLDAVQLGNIANSSNECTDTPYELKTLTSEAVHDDVTTDADGQAWLLVGTRSGFEGRTALYFTHITATLRPAS